ncbi:MAG: YcjX family protein [Alphaproteobacteria bacterium]|nr:YcjX family protein [Alphaproteobacteria bacterium]
MDFDRIWDGARLATGGLKDFATGLVQPTLRLGVTGLSRSGKTVFITALVHALLKNARMPVFEAHTQGRITRAYLEPQPDDDLPRFAYEDHLKALTAEERHWPEGTRRISQLRLTLEYEPVGFWSRNLGSGKLHIDIVDYPGEWLLDLPLINQTYQQWSHATITASRLAPRAALARDWYAHLQTLNSDSPANEVEVQKSASLFTAYLASCRKEDIALSSLPPGRFLLPGDLAGSPLLTFAPLEVSPDATFQSGSLGALMQRRYDAYVAKVVKPFFFGHFARLDRQIVLVDVLSALNAGSKAVEDLSTALSDVMASFRLGANNWASILLGRKVEKVLFAATKADQLHHTSHDRLEAILRLLVKDAMAKAQFAGADIDVAALAAIRATREASVNVKGEVLSCIAGIPQAGEILGATHFDGKAEAAIFPGDLPLDPQAALDGSLEGQLKFLKFRPPLLSGPSFSHIRLDRALEFLLGDRIL